MGCLGSKSKKKIPQSYSHPKRNDNTRRQDQYRIISNENDKKVKPDFNWLSLQFHDKNQATIKRPHDIELMIIKPPRQTFDNTPLDNIQGSMLGLALGDALGAHVEFRPREYLIEHPVTKLQGGGTWGLQTGQFTDDTTTALCLAISLIVCNDFVPYDQLVRYKWWQKYGYMSSTGQCFDIGKGTADAIREFERRQTEFAMANNIDMKNMDYLHDMNVINKFDSNCGATDSAGNGSLMRLASVPLFFHGYPTIAVEYSGLSSLTTHGDQKAVDACRYYGALIVAAVHGETKPSLLSRDFYQRHTAWFDNRPLHPAIQKIAEGSFKKPDGYQDGIRGKGYVVDALEAALWAFWSDENSFEKGILAAVNLGDDTDTTAAIYGQLAGAYYGYRNLPDKWIQYIYAKNLIMCLSDWICYEGLMWKANRGESNQRSKVDSRSNTWNSSSLPTSDVQKLRKRHSLPFRKHRKTQ